MPTKGSAKRASIHDTYLDQIEAIPDHLLKEEISRMLTVSNENEGRNLIRYNIMHREFRPITTFDPFLVLIEGNVDLIRGQIMPEIILNDSAITEDEPQPLLTSPSVMIQKKIQIPKLVRNRFNFSDKGSQTVDPRPRHQPMQTEPPATATFSANIRQDIIYDAYLKGSGKEEDVEEEPPSKKLPPKLNKLALVMERMIIQNLHERFLEDFKYYEDPADDIRGNYGCLLPLWKFAPNQMKDFSVTCLCWNPQYSDLFAVSFGSCSYTKQDCRGAIMMYSLKNPSYPTYSFYTEYGVMSLDINREFPQYMCVGLYDGSVAVYNLSKKTDKPTHLSKRGVHNMYISQVQWDKEGAHEQMSFNSVSPDGLIVKWILAPHGLSHHVLVTLDISDFIEKSMVEMGMMTFGSGISVDFHATNNRIYLVGTEMGHGHLCSRAHSTEALQTFDAHHLSIYKIAWNTFHPKIFITCSEDWTVKIWENEGNIRKPLTVFDLGSQVYDVEWAPYSSTVFAAVTARGEVFIYDLFIDKNEPLCEQVVVRLKRTRVMHLTFNKLHPVILVGDDTGEVFCLKLSPNLRKSPKERKRNVRTDKKSKETSEISRLEEVLTTFREKNV